MKTMFHFSKYFLLYILFVQPILGQTPEQAKLIEKAQRMQDSILNSPFYKNLEAQAAKEEAVYKTQKENVVKAQGNPKAQSDFPLAVENYPLFEMPLVTYPLGMENPIAIGTIAKDGSLNFDLPVSLPFPDGQISSVATDLATLFMANCYDYADALAKGTAQTGFKAGQIGLETKEGHFAGVLFVVSTENLVPWLEDPMYMEPVLGSYYELVYVSSPVDLITKCGYSMDTGNGGATVSYDYNLHLKEGYQFIKYSIQSIYKTDPSIRASFPDKVEVTSVTDLPKALWIGKYF